MYLSFLILSGTLECPVGNNIGIIVCDLYPIICCICGNQFSGCEWHYCKLKSGSLYLDKELIDLVTRNACPLRFLGSKGLHNAVNYTLYFCSFKGQTASSDCPRCNVTSLLGSCSHGWQDRKRSCSLNNPCNTVYFNNFGLPFGITECFNLLQIMYISTIKMFLCFTKCMLSVGAVPDVIATLQKVIALCNFKW